MYKGNATQLHIPPLTAMIHIKQSSGGPEVLSNPAIATNLPVIIMTYQNHTYASWVSEWPSNTEDKTTPETD